MLQYLSLPPTDSHQKAVELIGWFNGVFDSHNGLQWAIILSDLDRFIGSCGNIGWDRENRYIDIGYQILPSFWRQGYATEATHAMLRWSFDNMNLNRIQADCTDGNIGSERVLIKCGFKVEGIWREKVWEHGRFVDIKQFGLLRQDYNSISATDHA